MDQYLCKETKTRYHLLDAIRGVCILGMVAYHTLFDVFVFSGAGVSLNFYIALELIRDIGAGIFIFLSGFCFPLGAHRLRRLLVLTAAGAAVSLVTRIVLPEAAVIFGILTFMAASGAVMWGLDKPLRKVPPWVGAAVSFVLFFLFFRVNYGVLSFGDFVVAHPPAWLYRNYLTAFFGFPFAGFSSGDYYPLLPWIWIYLTGYFCSAPVLKRKTLHSLLRKRIPLLCTIGKYSLPIYLLHQPLIYGVVSLIFLQK